MVVVTTPDPFGQLLKQGDRLPFPGADKIQLAYQLVVQPQGAIGLVYLVDLSDGGDDPVQRDIAGRTLRIGPSLLGIDKTPPQMS